MGENTEINKQSHVKFWPNRKKYGAVSYLLSCINHAHFASLFYSLLVRQSGTTVAASQLAFFLTARGRTDGMKCRRNQEARGWKMTPQILLELDVLKWGPQIV